MALNVPPGQRWTATLWKQNIEPTKKKKNGTNTRYKYEEKKGYTAFVVIVVAIVAIVVVDSFEKRLWRFWRRRWSR